MHQGERLAAAALFKGPIGDIGPTSATASYQKDHGFEPTDDIAYKERAVDGYLGVTDRRLLLAKSPLWGSLKPRHVFADVPLAECSLVWYDWPRLMGTDRVMHLRLPEGQFASVFVPMQIRGLLSATDREAIAAAAEAVVAAFGSLASKLPAPKPEWLR